MITTCMIKLTKTNATMQWSTGLLTFDRNCTAVILVILNSVNEFSAGTMHAWVSYVTVQTRPDQPVARGQHVASDTVLCCPRRDFKWENVVWHFPWKSRDRMQKKFWKPTSCLFTEIPLTANLFCNKTDNLSITKHWGAFAKPLLQLESTKSYIF